jgi:hypothetical protein
MSWRATKKRLALAVCVLALLGGGAAVALAATGSSSPHRPHARQAHHADRHRALAVAAGYLGLSTQQLRAQLHAGRSLGEIADATPGHSEAGLRAALITAGRNRLQALQAQLPQRVAALVRHAGGHHGARRHQVRQAALAYLGLSAKQLQAELRGGRTLAQVADATPGRSAAGLASTIVGARRAQLDEAVAHGLITKHAASAREGELAARVHAMIAHARGALTQAR